MIVVKKIVSFYQYVYYRLFLFHKKQWQGDKRLGLLNSNFAISSSSIALVYSMDLTFRKLFNTKGFFNNNYKIIGLAVVVFFLLSIILSVKEETLEKKYAKANESDLSWRIKGFFSLSFVFGPIILLIILM